MTVEDGLVQISHRGVLVATHAQRHRPAKESQALRRKAKESKPRPRQPTIGHSVTIWPVSHVVSSSHRAAATCSESRAGSKRWWSTLPCTFS